MSDTVIVMGDRDNFLRELRRMAKMRGLQLEIDLRHGKGSHIGVSVGNRKTVIPYKLRPGTRAAILKQLGLSDK